MTNKDLANFYDISTQAVGRWTKERKHSKRVQAQAGAEQQICDLLADINKLAYIYDCQWLHGVEQKRWCWINRTSVTLFCHIFIGSVILSAWSANLHATDAVEQLQSIKTKLEELVYGVQAVDKRS